MGFRRRAVGVAVVAACGVALAGCLTSPPEPSPLTTTKQEPDDTASATKTPATSDGLEADSPVAAARQFFELINAAQRSGDVSALRAASAPECENCKTVADYIGGIYERGGRYEGDFDVRIVEAYRVKGTDPAVVVVTIDRKDYELVPESGAKPTPQPGQKTVWGVTVEERDGRWLVTKLVNET
ncbi:MAG TPA: DUF6318 family protein [Actinopolymorphaceae bacterium]|jgi:hypothetical protein